MLRTIFATAALATLMGATAMAQTDSANMPAADTSANAGTPAVVNPDKTTSPTVAPTDALGKDADILQELHAANLAEIQEGRLAQDKAASAKVQKYGKMLVKDHTEADKMVMKDAQKLNVNLSDTLPNEQQQEVDGLRSASSSDFDRTFIADARAGHEKLIADLEAAPKDNKTIRRLSDKLMPELRKHEKDARRLGNDVAKAP